MYIFILFYFIFFLIKNFYSQTLSFKKITFSLGGHNSRNYAKPAFNVKIRGNKELFGRSQFKLRSDISEPSYMRTKLMSDIHNKLGLPSLSANYILLYINDEFIGLYILTDVYKETWIEHVYGEKDTKNLYKCDSCSLTYDGRSGFENENKEATDKKELYEFLAKLTTAESWTDVESIFDIDQFYKEVAIDYLAASFDHINSYHNFYVYKNPQNNKWIYLVLDFDFDLGWTLSSFESDVYKTFEEYLENEVAYKLIYSNYDHFIEILKEIVVKVFNPATLFPRIDELKSFIRPYVKLDKTPNSDGKYPGRMNINDRTFYTMEEWEASTEYDISQLGLKQFILLKYKFVCQEYNIECDPNYLDNNNNITITETELLYPTETSTSIVDSTFIETTTSIEDTVLPTVTSIFDSNIDETTTSFENSVISTATSTFDSVDIETTTSVENTILPTVTSIFDYNIDETTTSIENSVISTATSTFDSVDIETTTSVENTILPTVTSIFDYNIDETTTSIEDSVLSTATSTFDSVDIETTTSVENTILPTVTSIFDSNIDETTTSIEDSVLSTATSTFDSVVVETTTFVEDTILPTATSTLEEPTEVVTSLKCLSEFIGYPCCSSEFTTVYAQDDYGDWGYDFTKNEWCGLTKNEDPLSQGNSDECWSEIYGYPCCSSKVKNIYAQDEYGDWGYDFTKNEWCGLAKHEDSSKQGESEECWSEIYGYPCCKGCRIYETDSNGSWGYEFNEWCGIISSRC